MVTAADVSSSSGTKNEPNLFGRILNTFRPPLNRTYTERSLRKGKARRRNSSPGSGVSSRGRNSSDGASHAGSSPVTSPPIRSPSSAGLLQTVYYSADGNTSAEAGSSTSPRNSLLAPSSANTSPAALSPGHAGSSIHFPSSHSSTTSLERANTPPVRPKPDRRQSSSRKLANAMRPLFRRSSSQTGTSSGNLQSLTASNSSSTSNVTAKGKSPGNSASGPPSPAALPGPVAALSASTQGRGEPRRSIVSSSSRSTHSMATSTPSPGTDTLHHVGFPSPFFAQATPTNVIPNPFLPSIDCVAPLIHLLSYPISATLAQLIPLNLVSPYHMPLPSSGLGNNFAGASSVSVATTSISDTGTTSTTQASSSTGPTPISSAWPPSSLPSTLQSQSSFVTSEQLAASSLNLPTTSVGLIWRLAQAFNWIAENGPGLNELASARINPMTPRGGPIEPSVLKSEPAQETSFDFASLTQAVLDVLAAGAAERSIDISLFHGSKLAQGQGMQSPTARAETAEIQEAFVRGDDRGLGVGLLAILSQMMSESSNGTSFEVGLSFKLTMPANTPNKNTTNSSTNPSLSNLRQQWTASDQEDEDNAEPPLLGTYFCTMEITQTQPNQSNAADSTPASPTGAAPANTLDSNIVAALLQYLKLTMITTSSQDSGKTQKITCALPQSVHPAAANQYAEAPRRRRLSIDQSREPTMSELLRFVETSLRGKKAALHSHEQSAFARHLSQNLASWGLDITHFSTSNEEEDTVSPHWEGASGISSRTVRTHGLSHLGRLDSGFGGSDSTSPPGAWAAGMASPSINLMADPMAAVPSSSVSPAARSAAGSDPGTSTPLDPALTFIIVDDDVPTLKRQLISVRNHAPTVQLHNALLSKRPQLQSRRTRSSQAIQRVTQTTVSIIHFTSLNNYRQIKELVHTILKSASPMFPLPEVLVVPKPVGPRRLLTTLFNAIKRPTLDPNFVPIATSPSSPGGHYFFAGGRPSPALSHSNANDFDIAAGQAIAAQQRQTDALSAAVSQASVPKTPPIPGQGHSNPPSPVSPDALEYFSKSAAELGSSASQGIIIQSPDGRPTGLFFQPRAASLHEKAESMRMSRGPGESGSSEAGSSSRSRGSPATTYTASIAVGTELPAIMIPDNMDIGATGRNFTLSPISASEISTTTPKKGDGISTSQPSGLPSSAASSTERSGEGDSISDDSIQEKQAEAATPEPPTPSSPPTKSGPPTPNFASHSRSTTSRSPPPSILSPVSPARVTSGGKQVAISIPSEEPSSPDDLQKSPTVPPQPRKMERRLTGKFKRVVRRPTGTLVPPINVLIVEDNPINQIILSTFLKRKGIKYSVANNGQEAVDAWKTGDFHLVLMDIQLPVKDGIEATQEIRAMERAGKGIGYGFLATPASDVSNPMSPSSSAATSPYELPVIIVALTASSLQSDRVNALAAGCNDFLTKPVSLVWLNQKLVEWGSMAYLSGFGLRRSMGSSTPSRENSLMQAVQEKTPEEKAAEAKAEKDAQKAKLMAMMQRRPPGLEKKSVPPTPAPIPAETVSTEQSPTSSEAVPMAAEGQEIPGQNKVQQTLQEVAPTPASDPAAESAAIAAGEQASSSTQPEASSEVIPGSDIRAD